MEKFGKQLASKNQIRIKCISPKCSFLPESFRWLFTKKRVDEAEQVVRRIATFNKLPFPRDVFDKVAQNSMKTETKVSGSRKNYTILDIFRSSVLRKRCLILAIMW